MRSKYRIASNALLAQEPAESHDLFGTYGRSAQRGAQCRLKCVDAVARAAAGSMDTNLSFLTFLELCRADAAERRMATRRVADAFDVVEHV